MVLILDGNSEHELRVKENNFKFITAVDLNKCLKQIDLPISLHTCEPISELLSNVSIT